MSSLSREVTLPFSFLSPFSMAISSAAYAFIQLLQVRICSLGATIRPHFGRTLPSREANWKLNFQSLFYSKTPFCGIRFSRFYENYIMAHFSFGVPDISGEKFEANF